MASSFSGGGDEAAAADKRGNSALETEIREIIRLRGRITFAEYMELALYHPEHGYYSNSARDQLGPRGDFYTSPENHPVFGTLIGRQLEQMWGLLGAPDIFTVVEAGAGSGLLCTQIVGYARARDFGRHLRYIIVEKSSSLLRKQQANLAELARDNIITWHQVTPTAPLPQDVVGCYLSNELLDAFAVHRVVMRDDDLCELYVGEAQGELGDVVGPPSTPALPAYFADLGIKLAEGTKAEVNLAALNWLQAVADSLRAGFIISIDYGYPAEELYSPRRREGTLLCYFHHTRNSEPYARVGLQDMTTHVDFTSLIRTGRGAGLDFAGMVNQSDFLINLGLEAYVNALDEMGISPAVRYDNRFAMRRLANPDALGGFKVLIQQKGLATCALDCLNPCNDAKRALILGATKLEVPLL